MELTMRNTLATLELEALEANTEKAIDFTERDDHVVFAVQNTASYEVTLTVKAGDGIQGVNDLVLTVPKGIRLFKLESGRFKVTKGDNKGKIIVVSNGTPSIGAAALV